MRAKEMDTNMNISMNIFKSFLGICTRGHMYSWAYVLVSKEARQSCLKLFAKASLGWKISQHCPFKYTQCKYVYDGIYDTYILTLCWELEQPF